jgi:glyoxylase-like metal-dependent hydrolase (beta-lactamase superfamily II)
MIEEILMNLYKIEIPLPGNPLRAVNSYVIKGPDHNLIIDTGMNREECLKEMQAGLNSIGIDLRKTDFFITHMHTDHLGLISNLVTDGSTVYFNQRDVDGIEFFDRRRDDFMHFARMNGFPEDELQTILNNHPGHKYRSRGHLAFTFLREDNTISIGDYVFRCEETPGHTKGHMCLYEPNRKVFIAGDHILNKITPNIQLWSDEWNPLKEYLASLDKVYQLDVELVLPGHGPVFRNCKERTNELRYHHEERLGEVLSLLDKRGITAYETASRMSWDIAAEYDSWDRFPALQKFFATGEAIAHLKYLEEKAIIRKETKRKRIIFSLNANRPAESE